MDADLLVACWLVEHYVDGCATPDSSHPMQAHLAAGCEGPIIVRMEVHQGVLSAETPNPQLQVGGWISCPHSMVVGTPQGPVDRGEGHAQTREWDELAEMLADLQANERELADRWADRVRLA